MSGLAQQLVGYDLFQRFDTVGTHTWVKPAGINMVCIEAIGGGGGGGHPCQGGCVSGKAGGSGIVIIRYKFQ